MVTALSATVMAPLLSTSGAIVGAAIAGTTAFVVARQNNAHMRQEEELRRRHAVAQSIRQDQQALYARFLAVHTALTHCILLDTGTEESLRLGEQAELLLTTAEEILLVGSEETAEQATRLADFYFRRLADGGPPLRTTNDTAEIKPVLSALMRSMKADLRADLNPH